MKNNVLPERKNIRWYKQDYSHPGEYMITVCTKDMKQILSRITVNPQTVGDDVPVVPNSHSSKIEEGFKTKISDAE